MGGGAGMVRAKDYPAEYLAASALSATINYPLWRASAIGQSGFAVTSTSTSTASALGNTATTTMTSSRWHTLHAWWAPYRYALSPPYKGAVATVLGMTWARAAIFWGSDTGRDWLLSKGYNKQVATVVPPLTVSTLVQFVNMPVVRATITIQNPQSELPTVWQSVQHIYRQHGLKGLWHGTSAGILKTVPKYCTAVIVKDVLEDWLPRPDVMDEDGNYDRTQVLARSAVKSVAAGVAGATLTNPLDVIRNEMFKTNLSLKETVRHLRNSSSGYGFCARGLGHNMIAVAVPVACTIFFTDALIQYSSSRSHHEDFQQQQQQQQQQR